MLRKTCPACGESFDCCADTRSCWCERENLSGEVLAALRGRYDDCLCPRCLAAAAENRIPEQPH